MVDIFENFEFINAIWGDDMSKPFYCAFKIGLNPYEVREYLDEIRERLAGICRDYRLLGSVIRSADCDGGWFMTADELSAAPKSIWCYIAVC